jgi:hypothetical protein
MKGYDPEGNTGPKKPLPDYVRIYEPAPDKVIAEPLSEQKEPVSVPLAAVPEETPYQQQDGYQQDGYTEQPVF